MGSAFWGRPRRPLRIQIFQRKDLKKSSHPSSLPFCLDFRKLHSDKSLFSKVETPEKLVQSPSQKTAELPLHRIMCDHTEGWLLVSSDSFYKVSPGNPDLVCNLPEGILCGKWTIIFMCNEWMSDIYHSDLYNTIFHLVFIRVQFKKSRMTASLHI